MLHTIKAIWRLACTTPGRLSSFIQKLRLWYGLCSWKSGHIKDWKEVCAFDILYFSLEGNVSIFDHHNKFKSIYMYTLRKFTDTQNGDEQSTQQMVWFLQEVLWTNILRFFFIIVFFPLWVHSFGSSFLNAIIFLDSSCSFGITRTCPVTPWSVSSLNIWTFLVMLLVCCWSGKYMSKRMRESYQNSLWKLELKMNY